MQKLNSLQNNNLIHLSTCYACSVKKANKELKLERALDEDSLFLLLLHWARQLFLGMPPLISNPVFS